MWSPRALLFLNRKTAREAPAVKILLIKKKRREKIFTRSTSTARGKLRGYTTKLSN